MGKKRRILTRTTKFAKKYFEFLDKVDATTNVPESGGEESDDILERVDPFVDTVSVADNENQTVTVTGTVIGNVPGMGAAAARVVEVSVDGGKTFPHESVQMSDAGTGIAKFTYSCVTTGALTKNKDLKVVVRPKGTTSKTFQKNTTTRVRENKIALVFTAGDQAGDAFSDNGADNIAFDASDIALAATPGKKKAGDTNNAALPGAVAHAIGIRVEVLLASDRTVQTLTGDVEHIDIASDIANIDNADEAALLAAAVGADTDFIIRLTPLSADDPAVLLTESAVEKTLTVTKQE